MCIQITQQKLEEVEQTIILKVLIQLVQRL